MKEFFGKLLKVITNLKFLVGIQLLATVAFLFVIVNLNVLPTLYLAIVAAIFLLISAAVVYVAIVDHKRNIGKVRSVIVKLFSVVLSFALIVGSVYVVSGQIALNKMTGANAQTTRYSVIVLNDDTYDNVRDLKGLPIQMCNINDDEEHVEKAIEALEDKIKKVDISYVEDYGLLADNLYDKEVEAIFINEGLLGFFETEYPEFDSETKVLWSVDITIEVDDFAKNVNVTEEAFNIYISGIDTEGPVNTVSRSDVNMIVSVNPYTRQILMTSIPRDLFVPMADSGVRDKLTHSGLLGAKNTVKTVENFTGLDINYYARVNFTSLKTIVDALGGITVYSPFAFSCHGQTYVVGNNYMDGAKALTFARERYAFEGGDNERIRNQQRVLTGIIQKALSPAIITNYMDVLSAVQNCLETNMSTDEITALVKMQLKDMEEWTFTSQQMIGVGALLYGGAYSPGQQLYYSVPVVESVNQCVANINKLFDDEVVTDEETEYTGSVYADLSGYQTTNPYAPVEDDTPTDIPVVDDSNFDSTIILPGTEDNGIVDEGNENVDTGSGLDAGIDSDAGTDLNPDLGAGE